MVRNKKALIIVFAAGLIACTSFTSKNPRKATRMAQLTVAPCAAHTRWDNDIYATEKALRKHLAQQNRVAFLELASHMNNLLGERKNHYQKMIAQSKKATQQNELKKFFESDCTRIQNVHAFVQIYTHAQKMTSAQEKRDAQAILLHAQKMEALLQVQKQFVLCGDTSHAFMGLELLDHLIAQCKKAQKASDQELKKIHSSPEALEFADIFDQFMEYLESNDTQSFKHITGQLVQRGPKIFKNTNPLEETMLMTCAEKACNEENFSIVVKLSKPLLNLVNKNGKSALSCALKANNKVTVKVLLESGATIDQKISVSNQLISPLAFAVRQKNLPIIKLMLSQALKDKKHIFSPDFANAYQEAVDTGDSTIIKLFDEVVARTLPNTAEQLIDALKDKKATQSAAARSEETLKNRLAQVKADTEAHKKDLKRLEEEMHRIAQAAQKKAAQKARLQQAKERQREADRLAEQRTAALPPVRREETEPTSGSGSMGSVQALAEQARLKAEEIQAQIAQANAQAARAKKLIKEQQQAAKIARRAALKNAQEQEAQALSPSAAAKSSSASAAAPAAPSAPATHNQEAPLPIPVDLINVHGGKQPLALKAPAPEDASIPRQKSQKEEDEADFAELARAIDQEVQKPIID